MPGALGNIVMEGAEIAFRNFAGREGMYNAEGDRSFCVMLPEDLAQQLEADGWNVRRLKVREEGDTPQAYLQVSVKYRGRNGSQVRPPTIMMVTSRNKTSLNENFCEILDHVDIKESDLIIRPYEWAVNGKTGVKAYLKAIYAVIQEDVLQLKYQDVQEVSLEGQPLAIGGEEIWEGEVISESDDDQLAIGSGR